MDQEQAAGAECLHYAAASYDELVLLASWLRQHQIRGGGGGGPPGPGKPVIGPLHLNHAFQHQQQQQQQHMLVARIGRSAVDSGLLPLPLSLGSGADSGDDVDASFKTLASAVVGDGLFNRFGGELQRSAPPTAANHQSFHHPQVTASPLFFN